MFYISKALRQVVKAGRRRTFNTMREESRNRVERKGHWQMQTNINRQTEKDRQIGTQTKRQRASERAAETHTECNRPTGNGQRE